MKRNPKKSVKSVSSKPSKTARVSRAPQQLKGLTSSVPEVGLEQVVEKPSQPQEFLLDEQRAIENREREAARAVRSGNHSNQPVRIMLGGEIRFKIESMDHRLERAVDAVRRPIIAAYAQQANKAIEQAISNSEQCKLAQQDRTNCIQEVLDSVANDLPEGYRVTKINLKEGSIIAEYLADSKESDAETE